MKNIEFELSEKGLKYLEELEDVRLEAYKDDAGVLTIGIGSTEGVNKGDIITMDEVYQRFKKDSKWVLKCLENVNIPNLNQNQFDALFFLIFNIGAPRFISSTVLKKIREKANRKDIENAWQMWNKIRNPKTNQLVISKGLNNRRKKEINYYFTPL